MVVEPVGKNIRNDSHGCVVWAVSREVGVIRAHEGGVAGDLPLNNTNDAYIAMLVGDNGEQNGKYDQTGDRNLHFSTRSKEDHLYKGKTLGEKSEHEYANNFKHATRKKRDSNNIVRATEDEEGNDSEHESEHRNKYKNVLLTRLDKGSANSMRQFLQPLLHLK